MSSIRLPEFISPGIIVLCLPESFGWAPLLVWRLPETDLSHLRYLEVFDFLHMRPLKRVLVVATVGGFVG